MHDYSLAGYLLSPNPTIMAHGVENQTIEHEQAVERLIAKLILSPTLVGTERRTEEARLINKFHEELGDFREKRGHYARPHIWITAADDDVPAFRWHQRFSNSCTEVLGPLSCLVLSKILGIGTAERSWKQVKAVKSGQRSRTSVLKTKKQVMIYGQYQQEKSKLCHDRATTAGHIWNDADFRCCKMDAFCGVYESELEIDKSIRNGAEAKVFHAWRERWEMAKISPAGDGLLEQRLLRKYGGLKWKDPVDPDIVLTVHLTKMEFKKERGNNQYVIIATKHRFDFTQDEMHEDNIFKWDPWGFSTAFYDAVYEFNKDNRLVLCYTKGEGGCESEEE